MKILIMGLPGSGKSTLAAALATKIGAQWFEADLIRAQYNDWDFSLGGRLRQAQRMSDLASDSPNAYVIADFVAPLQEMRDIYKADYTVWVDTIPFSRYEDTNKLFDPPKLYDLRVTEQDVDKWADIITKEIITKEILNENN